jgi:predicted N-formylglutamate amidohydrolase
MLTATDADPVLFHNAGSDTPNDGRILLTCEHGGRAIPSGLGDLGVCAAQMDRHIAWDIGAMALSLALVKRVSARLVAQRYSRLVIDCNRGPISPELIPVVSDGTHIPANAGISATAINARTDAIHAPFHARIAKEIRQLRPALLVSIHSFTPNLAGVVRPMHAGFLANRMPDVSERFMASFARQAPELTVAQNAPYEVDDFSDYTVPVHGESNCLPHVLVEVRNDQLRDDRGIERWADLLSKAINDVEPSQ